MKQTWDERLKWYEENLKIRTKAPEIVPFRLNKIQLSLERYIWEQEQKGEPCYIVVLKARQEGVSTLAEGAIFRKARQVDHLQALIIAHKEDSSKKIFEMSKRYYDLMPNQPELHKASAREIKFKDTDSELAVETAGAGKGGGRGFTAQAVHFSEADFYPDPEELFGAVMQSIPRGPTTFVIVESTANGPMGFMEALWNQAIEGRSEFRPFFFAWFDHEEYTRPITWADLNYAERTWVATNRSFLDKKIKEEGNGLGSVGYGRADSAGYGDGGSGSERADSGHQVAEEGADRDSGKQDAGTGVAERAGNDVGGGSGPDEREGLRSRGLLHADSGQRGPSVGEAGSETPSGDGSDAKAGGAAGWIPQLGVAREGDRLGKEKGGLGYAFRGSLTEYEIGLIQEYDLTLEQINWYRWCTETNCRGDDTRLKREYPSRPEEAFAATGADVLDPAVLSKWTKESIELTPSVGRMVGKEISIGQIVAGLDPDDRHGKTTIWEHPRKGHRYVAALDPASGQNVEEGDWHVCFVMDVDSGDQVAEYRSKVDPDMAVDEIELLAIYYNLDLLAIETNSGWGAPFVKHLVDRGTVKLYEREILDKYTRRPTKTPGWNTSTKTRPLIVSESKEAVRKERCRIRSQITLAECRTLHENAVGKIEARPNKHDDGWIAFGVTAIMRNRVLGIETASDKTDRKTNSFVRLMNTSYKKKMRMEKQKVSGISTRLPIPLKRVGGEVIRPDGRRSAV